LPDGIFSNQGEPLWLSGKVVKIEKINEMRGPGFAPHPGGKPKIPI
jgi:hypothetical protein